MLRLPDYCPLCHRAADRNAMLVVTLRRTSRRLHVSLCHKGEWVSCHEPACTEIVRVIMENKISE